MVPADAIVISEEFGAASLCGQMIGKQNACPREEATPLSD